MKKINLLILALFLCAAAHAQNTFEKAIDTLGFYPANCVQQTFDGGYIMCGTGVVNGNDALIVKLDSAGTIEWAKSYSGPGSEGAVSVFQLPDSGYIVNAIYDLSLNTKNWLLRLNTYGDTLWTKTYSAGNGSTDAYQMAISANTAFYALAGHFSIPATGFINASLVIALSNGLQVASKLYGVPGFKSQAESVDNTFDNGFVFTGSYGLNTSDIWLVRTNYLGDTIWQRKYDKSFGEIGFAVEQTADSGFIIGGSTMYSVQYDNAYFIKTNSIGDTLWTKQYGGNVSCIIRSVANTSDGGYIATGRIVSSINPTAYLYLMRLNATGDTLWTKQFGNQAAGGYYVRQTTDGGFIICGENNIAGVNYAYLIKTDSLGNVTTGLNSVPINNPFSFTISPNPSSGSFMVRA